MTEPKLVKITVRLSEKGGTSASNTLWFLVREEHALPVMTILKEKLAPHSIVDEAYTANKKAADKKWSDDAFTTPEKLTARFAELEAIERGG